MSSKALIDARFVAISAAKLELKLEVAEFNSASEANVASNDELKSSCAVILVLNDPLSVCSAAISVTLVAMSDAILPLKVDTSASVA